MSILINMEMPKSCAFCLCARVVDGSCRITGYNPTFSEWYEDGVKDCPLIEIPPHGRLIDALEINEAKWVHPDTAWQMGWNSAIDAILKNAQTIIEAEGVDK